MSPMAIGRLFKFAIELGVCRPDWGSIQSGPERIFAVSIYARYSYALNLPSMIELPKLRLQKQPTFWHQGYRKMPAKQVDTDSGTAVSDKSFATHFEPPNNVIESLTASFFQHLRQTPRAAFVWALTGQCRAHLGVACRQRISAGSQNAGILASSFSQSSSETSKNFIASYTCPRQCRRSRRARLSLIL